MLMTSKTASEQFLVLEDDRGHTEHPHLRYFLQELIYCVASEIWLTLKLLKLLETQVSALPLSTGFLPT